MAFKIGQRIRLIRSETGENVGLLGTIVGAPFPNGSYGLCQFVDWADGDHRCGIVANMVKVDDDSDYKRFMERVLEPRPELQGLPLEIAA